LVAVKTTEAISDRSGPPPFAAMRRLFWGYLGCYILLPPVLSADLAYWLGGAHSWFDVDIFAFGPVMVLLAFPVVRRVPSWFSYGRVTDLRRFWRLSHGLAAFEALIMAGAVVQAFGAGNAGARAQFVTTLALALPIYGLVVLLLVTLHRVRWFDPDAPASQWELADAAELARYYPTAATDFGGQRE
jgi:hypothetical protein